MITALGFGFMKASFQGTEENRETTIAALHEAMRQGVKLFDTADIYAPTWNTFGHNERILAEAIRTFNGDTSDLLVATKAGITRGPGEAWGRSANLDYLLRAVEASCGRLGLSKLPLWQHHRLDPSLPLETQLENIAKLQEQGLIERIGVSNYSAKQLNRALELIPNLYSVQNQLNPAYRHDLEVLEVCVANNVVFLPWSPTKGARGEQAQQIIKDIASETNATTYQVAIAWLRSLSTSIVPIPGVSRVESVQDAIAALNLELSQDQLDRINTGLEPSLPVDKELLSDQPKN